MVGDEVVAGDNPVDIDGDLLDRSPVAHRWAKMITETRAPGGIAFALAGAWGSGKTSIINMMRPAFTESGMLVIDFNPWLFSGTDQLIASFFAEFSAQLDISGPVRERIANSIQKYGQLIGALKFVPLAGSALAAAGEVSKFAGAALGAGEPTIQQLRERIIAELSEVDQQIVVVIDDIDRLTGPEIRDIFRLVRLTGSFPNVTYLLAFDRARVEAALREDGVPGRAYLEKIVQVVLDVPAPSKARLDQLLFAHLDAVFRRTSSTRFHKPRWPKVYDDIIRPLIKNVRDIKRYVAPLPPTFESLAGQVELVDVLALEAIRVFLPDAFTALAKASDGLTTPSGMFMGHDDPRLKRQVEDFIASEPAHRAVLVAVCRHLFDASHARLEELGSSRYGSDWQPRWLKERRVAHIKVLEAYLERVMPSEVLAATHADLLFLGVQGGLAPSVVLGHLDRDMLEETIVALEAYENDFREEHARTLIPELLNSLPRLQREARGMFDFGPGMAVSRVVLRILRRIEPEAKREEIIGEVLSRVTGLHERWDLYRLIGYDEGAGHKLVPESYWKEVGRRLALDVRAASVEVLTHESDLLWILLWASRVEGIAPWAVPADYLHNAAFVRTLLRSSVSEVRREDESGFVRIRGRLSWDSLLELLGSEEAISACVDRVADAYEEEADLVSLARRYLEGWRPPDFLAGTDEA